MLSVLLNFAFSQTDSEKIQTCLNALYKDQIKFIRSSGHFAAHVNLLENSEKEACFGVQLKMSRQTIRDFKITGSMNDKVWQINQNKKFLEMDQQK